MKRKNHIPPKLAHRFLTWFLRDDLAEEVQGDLEEQFYRELDITSPFRARLNYCYQVVNYLRPFAIGKSRSIQLIYYAMFQNYFKIGWRNLLKYRNYSIINILGLSIGFGATLLLLLIINYENSYDKFHADHDNLYRVATRDADGNISDLIVTPQIPLMREEYPDIIGATRFFDGWSILQYDDTYALTGYHIVDPDFADMFNFRALKGNIKEALSTRDQMILTVSFAEKLFGSDDPMGQTVSIVDEDLHFTVAAIVEDPPKNSSLKFEVLIPWANAPSWLDVDQAGNWYNTFMTGYVRLSLHAKPEQTEEKLRAFVQDHFLEERKSSQIALLPLSDEHFRLTNNKRIISILGIIAVAILLISCLNFMNLSISQLLGRTKEIGVRKVMGSKRGQLVNQFTIEGLIISLFAIVIGIMTVYSILPKVNTYFSFDIRIGLMENLSILYFIAAICLFTLLICTLWPSVALSGLKPVNSMKGVITSKKSGGYFRKGLIVLQFSSSILLIVGTVVIWSQVQFMKNRDLKFSGDHVVSMLSWPELFKDADKTKQELIALRDQLENETLVKSATLTECVPGSYNENYNGFQSVDSVESKSVSLRQTTVDHKYFDTFKMKIVYGRNFSQANESDKQTVIINETAMKAFGWTDIDDKQLRSGGGAQIYNVIGVVEDYYYQSLKRSIQPVIHFYNPEVTTRLAVRLDPDRLREGIAMLESKWNKMDPYEPFDYSFVDETFDALYKEQERLGTTSSLFSLIAIIIAGLGLFSITSYTIRLRKKEIGIRKVLGASMWSIIVNLSGTFGVLILSSFVLVCPLIYLLSDAFLKDFTYRITLSPWIFIAGGAMVFLTAMLIVSVQSGKAAMENPVNALRDE
ncbi:MAG: ABC transporter permease [Cytophagales bacterium]|nr:ABC transporter permease [Cytophagales bacterium]